MQAFTAFKGTLAMDHFDDTAEWPEVKPWDTAAEEVMGDEDKADMRLVADMSELDNPAGGVLYKQCCVASERDKAETLCGFALLHNSMVCAARLFDLISAFQTLKSGPWKDMNVDKKIEAMKPFCAGILKLHSRLERSQAWSKAKTQRQCCLRYCFSLSSW